MLNASFGRYQLLERLGEGGMAEVFKAKSRGVEGFEKIVVIKRILPSLATSPEFVERFIHEAKLAVRLSHANVVQVFDLGIAPGSALPNDAHGEARPDAYYMAMEYVSGFDLQTLLSRCRREQIAVPFEMAIYVAAEIAKGLDHAHRRRDEDDKPLHIVHLDVSPQNILLSLEGEVKVTDFGIARAQGALTRERDEDTRVRRLEGKFCYMSPEQVVGSRVDARSDLFSLGVVLYEMLAGANPFRAPTSLETLRRVAACEYPPLALLRPDVPAPLAALVSTAMAPLPTDRFADAGRMYEALVALLYGQGRRYSAHQLAAFLGRLRAPDETGPNLVLDTDKTPVAPSRREAPSSAKVRAMPAAAFVALDVERAAGLGECRDVTALVVELPCGPRTVDEAETSIDTSRHTPVAERIDAVVTRHGGRVISRDPEQLTVIFGLDEPDGHDTELATRCALVVVRTQAGVRAPSAGIHVGRVHVSGEGLLTDDDRLASLVATARDLSRVREGGCAISASAAEIVRAQFELGTLDETHTRRGSQSTTLLVRGVKHPQGTFGTFVGRRAELRNFGEVLATTTRRSAQLLTLRGEHGIGKTRFLFEIERRLRKGQYNIGWHVASCPARGADTVLSGIQCMMHVLCGVTEGDPDPPAARIVPRLRALGLHEDEVRAVLLALGVHVTPPPNVPASLLEAFARMVQRLCEDRPHVFVWDSAHAMDTASLAIIDAVVARLPSARALFVFAERPGGASPKPTQANAGGGRTIALDLTPLEASDTAKLLAHRLGVSHVPDELFAFVQDRSGGHPQVVEELAKALLDARAVTIADSAVATMQLADDRLALPKSLRGLVGARTQRLKPAERSVLQAAATLSEPLELSVLARMIALDTRSFDRTVASLVGQSLLAYAGPLELRFVSPVVREVVASAMTAEAARAMHAAAGHALQRVDDAVEEAERIAYHLDLARERSDAAMWFGAGAERAIAHGRFDGAARGFLRAIDLSVDDSERPELLAEWLSGLARALSFVGSLASSADTCARVVHRIDALARMHCSAPSDEASFRALRVRARVDAARVLGSVDEAAAASGQLSDAMAIAEGDVALETSVIAAGIELAGRAGDMVQAACLLDRLRAMPEDKDVGERHRLLTSLAQVRAAMGDDVAALEHLARAEALVPNDPLRLCERQKLRAFIAYCARDAHVAVSGFQRASELARELGLVSEVAINLHNLGDALVQLGDHARAYGAVKQSLALSEELGQARLTSHNRMFLAFLDGVRGDGEALEVLTAGIAYAEAYAFTWDALGGRLLRAKLHVTRGALALARDEYLRLSELAAAKGHRVIEQECKAALRSLEPLVQAANPMLSNAPSRKS